MSEFFNDTTDRTRSAGLEDTDRFDVLRSSRRRVAIDVLADRTAPADLDEIAVAIAEREETVDPDDERARERVAATLHHTHLPKLARFGVVDYDPEKHRVESCHVPASLRTAVAR